MFYSVAVIVFVMVIAVAFTGMCTFERDTADNSHLQKVDADSFLNLEARSSQFPIRLPNTPEEWTINSARRSAVAGKQAAVVGWVLHKDGYISLTQTDATAEEAVDDYSEHPVAEDSTYQIDNQDVTKYRWDERDVRDLRVVDLGNVRLLVSGAATDDEFDDFISKVINTDPIPVED